MTRRLEGRSAADTVAVVASANGAVVVNPRAAGECRRRMTEMAIQRGTDVVVIHTDRRRAVVTRSAIVHDAGMVECRGDEAGRIVTDAAVLIGGDMIV